jgi:hypothetical protein
VYISCACDQIWGKTRKIGHEYAQCMGRLKHILKLSKKCVKVPRENSHDSHAQFGCTKIHKDGAPSITIGTKIQVHLIMIHYKDHNSLSLKKKTLKFSNFPNGDWNSIITST